MCLASVDDPTIRKYYQDNDKPTCGESSSFGTFTHPENVKEKRRRKKGKKNRKTKRKDNGKKNEKKENCRLSGASTYLSDTNPNNARLSRHHPWQCSLRFQGFRGRHRCGVTLLSGPTEQSPSDPFVLVGAAHCNYMCKDRRTGYPLETCCCRRPEVAGSCRQNNPGKQGSPFCPKNPDDAEFKPAEPADMVIICGEFDTDVELIWWSKEPEVILEIEEIINHPGYTPHQVGIY